jgi:hypothetical protein
MPIFKSKYPNLEIPNKTIPDFLFGEWTSDLDAKLAYVDGFSGEKLSYGELRQIAFKV